MTIKVHFSKLIFCLVFLEHDQLDDYINGMVLLSEDGHGGRFAFCGVCQKQGSKQDIERHIESWHIQTNPFPCEICGKNQKTRRSLQIHLRLHK